MFGNPKTQDLPYCAQVVKDNDPDRFLVSLVMPPARRAALWALFAFNYEIARTREVVSEPALGHIRLQWWREAMEAVYEKKAMPEHEVVKALAHAIRAHALPRASFDDLVDARMSDLENAQPATLEALEAYAWASAAPLARLTVKVIGGAAEHEAVGAVAAAYALTGLIRAVPFHARQGRKYMPADLAAKDPHAAVKAVADRARDLLKGAKPADKFTRAQKRIALLYLGQLARAGHDPYAPGMGAPPAFFHLRFLLNI